MDKDKLIARIKKAESLEYNELLRYFYAYATLKGELSALNRSKNMPLNIACMISVILSLNDTALEDEVYKAVTKLYYDGALDALSGIIEAADAMNTRGVDKNDKKTKEDHN
jgi:hypothetical protein